MVFVLLAYVAVAVALSGHPYNNLWGGVAATVAGAGWYASPLRRLEGKRRERLRGRMPAAATGPAQQPGTE
jgi:hypothetical protein